MVLEMVDRLETVKRSVETARDSLRAVGPEWESNDDMRSKWFDTVFKVLLITQANLHLFRSFISNFEWWRSIAPSLREANMEWIRSETNTLNQWVLLHSTYSTMEESLRRVTEAYDPVFMANRRTFSRITGHLCNTLDLRRYNKLFRLAALTRNTVHNNGHFRPDFGGARQQVTWQGRTYRLRFGKSIDYVNWDFTASHIEHLTEAMCSIMTHKRIFALPRIRR